MPEQPLPLRDQEPKDFPDDAYTGISLAQMLDHANRHIAQLQTENRALRDEARYDALTGLPNRRQLDEDMSRLVAEKPGQFGALFIDIDGLSETNRVYGHYGGDDLIRRAARTLEKVTRRRSQYGRPRSQDTIGEGAYRLAGDEMVVILEGIRTQADVNKVSERISGRLTEQGVPASVAGRPHIPGESMQDLIVDIDELMYDVKLQRKLEAHSPAQREMIQHIGRLAAEHGINLRDVALVNEALQLRNTDEPLE